MAGSKWLQSFANAVIDRGLPRIRTWLQARFGPDAQLDGLRLDEGQVHLDGATLPLGGAALLHVERASMTIESAPLKSPKVRMTSLRGEIRVSGDDEVSFTAPIELVSSRSPNDDAWFDGTFEVKGAHWTSDRGVGDHSPLDGRIDVYVTLTRWKLSDGKFKGAHAHIEIEAEGAMDNTSERSLSRARLQFREARAGHLIDALVALTGKRGALSMPLPFASMLTGYAHIVDGDLELEAEVVSREALSARIKLPEKLTVQATLKQVEDGRTGEVLLNSAWSSATLKLSQHGGALDGSSLALELSAAEAVDLGLLPPSIHITDASPLRGELSVTGSVADAVAVGRLSCDRLQLVPRDRSDVPLLFEDVRGRLTLTRTRIDFVDVTAAAFGGTLGAHGTWVLDGEQTEPIVVLRLCDLDRTALTTVTTLAKSGMGWPEQLALNGEVTLEASYRAHGTLALDNDAGTALLLALALSSDRAVDGTTLTGRAALADLAAMGWLKGSRLRPVGSVKIDGRLSGSLNEARFDATVAADRLWFDVSDAVAWCVDDTVVHVCVDHESFVYDGLRGQFYGGVIESGGVRARTKAFTGVDVHIGWSRVDLAKVPAGESATLGSHLAGRLSGSCSIRRKDGAPWLGSGEAVIDDPSYHALERVNGKARELGLPPPSTAGTVSLRSDLHLSKRGLNMTELVAQTRDWKVNAQIDLGFDGSLGGRGQVRFVEEYLRRSVLLAVPAVIAGDVTLPFGLSGSVKAPSFDADIMGALGGVLRHGKVVNVMSGAVDTVVNAVDGMAGAVDGFLDSLGGTKRAARPTHRDPKPRSDHELEAVVDRILRDDDDSDRLIDRLIDAGVSVDDIYRVLERRRLR